MKLDFHKRLHFLTEEVAKIRDIANRRPRVFRSDNFRHFKSHIKYAIAAVLKEKEILVFSLLQWVSVGLCYYLAIQMLDWIPDDVWRNEESLYDFWLNIVFFLWCLLCIGLAALPIGILSGCIGASHFLTSLGQRSTVIQCFRLVLPSVTNLWILFWLDGFMTVDQILERLPKRGSLLSIPYLIASEAVYFAWKVGTLAVLPSLLNGNGLIAAGKESINFLKKRPLEAMMLRGGYSLACWVVGLTAYVGFLVYFINYPVLSSETNFIYKFYFYGGVPILIAAGVIILVLRPIYVIASCKLYSEYLQSENKAFSVPSKPSVAARALVAFLVLLLIVYTIYVYRETLGIMDILRVH